MLSSAVLLQECEFRTVFTFVTFTGSVGDFSSTISCRSAIGTPVILALILASQRPDRISSISATTFLIVLAYKTHSLCVDD